MLQSRNLWAAFAIASSLSVAACGSGNPDSMVGKDINMNAIVDTNAAAVSNSEEAQYPRASNAVEAPVPKDSSDIERSADNSAETVRQPGQDAPPPDTSEEPPATDSNTQ